MHAAPSYRILVVVLSAVFAVSRVVAVALQLNATKFNAISDRASHFHINQPRAVCG